MRRLLREERAVSSVVATLLFIGVAVAASVITYSWVMSMIGSQSQQAQTRLRIDMVAWNFAEGYVSVTVRNIGSVPAMVDSVGVKKNESAGKWYLDSTEKAEGSIPVEGKLILIWASDTAVDANGSNPEADFIGYSTSYVIRVTCTTGFYHELVAATPEA